MKYILVLAISLLTLSFSFLSFQNSKFSGDITLFPEELENFMDNISGEHEETVESFITAWEEDTLFSIKEKENIIRHCQMMEKRKARPYPQFVNYIDCMMAFKHGNVTEENYLNWVNGMDAFLENRKATPGKISSFLKFSLNLIRDNSIYSSHSTIWNASSHNYKILVADQISVEFEHTDLVCKTLKEDSITIFNTSGRVFPLDNIWEGTGGKVTWEIGGYDSTSVFAELKDYKVELKMSEYEAEDVTFINKEYLKEPMKGKLQDKVKHVSKTENATYPRFYSYTETFYINDLYTGVDYTGGLSMQGAKMVGRGTPQHPAHLYIFRNDTVVLEASSLYFGFKSDRVASEQTSITIKLKQDSIYHPDLYLDFRTDARELTLLKTDSYTSQGPYTNSYHNLEMNFDQLIWRIDEDYMRFTAPRGTTIGNAYFESVNYFNFNKYESMMMMDRVHPLISIRSFSKQFLNETFPIQAYAKYMGMSGVQVKHQIMRMAYNGFVYYDPNSEIVTIKPKLHNYIAASVNRIDYDVIGFESQVETPLENAVFDLRSYDLIINGIPSIQVSDSQNVVIYPKGSKITVKQNRNFVFDGKVEAGLITFEGSQMVFNYDNFSINMQMVDAVKLDYLTGDLDNYGLGVTGSINNMIQGLTGNLLIDKADNKSGRVYYPEYPIFTSNEQSYVYYESDNLFGGVYNSNDFYFAVDPFTMDSLDNFNAYSMVYKGEFVSAGILPTFREELSLQEDNSLGFKHKTPDDGLPLYGGKGKLFDEIQLSNSGLRGTGTLKYLTSTTWSEEFQFFPDSMNSKSQKYTISKKSDATQFPSVKSVNNDVHWQPYGNKMYVAEKDSSFNMFNDSTYLSGNLLLEPSGLSGKGRMDLKNSDLVSDRFTYKANEIFADTSDFFLKSLKATGFTVLTENVNSHISFTKRKGWFGSNEGYSLVTFPENKYISYIDQFIWDMPEKEVAMGARSVPEEPDYTQEDVEPEGPRFISTDPDQDSLSFVSPLAYYDYEKNLINGTGVKFLEVADARIYPKKGLITVRPDYKVETLTEARIKANRTSGYHSLHDATVHIEGRKDYYGMGNYDYVDENDDVQELHFQEVKVDSNQQTVAYGKIFPSLDFTLSPVYRYQGDVFLFADDSLLTFDGALKIEHACDEITPSWISFKTRIDPKDIYIPIDNNLKDINGQNIFSSLYVYYDSVHIYPAFFNNRKNYSDNPIVSPSGYLHYDKTQELFKVGSMAKINNYSLSEEYMSLHRERCEIHGEGHLKLGEKLGAVKLTNYGIFTHNIEENKTELNLVMGIDFPIQEELINLMGREVDSFPNLKAVNLNKSVIVKTNNAWIGEERAKVISDELNLFGSIKELPPELKHTILLNELKLVWNDETNSYQSVGPIGIASINGIQINKEVEGFFELRIKRSGDMMDLYLQLDRRTYYYFGYTRSVMQTLSHNRTYVQTLMDMKAKDRKVKTDSDTPYNYLVSTDRKKDNFYRRWQDLLSGNTLQEDEDADFNLTPEQQQLLQDEEQEQEDVIPESDNPEEKQQQDQQ